MYASETWALGKQQENAVYLLMAQCSFAIYLIRTERSQCYVGKSSCPQCTCLCSCLCSKTTGVSLCNGKA
ncbi:hypothetical protein RB195_022739 [Necator americanus]|uniref:Uncharacterized protein n=1 Tax=Necator americanus TaxID=51031 RepID=A0ABR1EGN8_NECAM